MPWWEWALDVVGALLLLVVLVVIFLVVRRRMLSAGGTAFELSHRVRSDHAGRGWRLGLGRYDGDELKWFRIFSADFRPARVWHRRDVEYAGRREREGAEEFSLYADHVVICCDVPDGILELAMDEASLKGFQAWLEAMPPGSRSVRPGEPTTGM